MGLGRRASRDADEDRRSTPTSSAQRSPRITDLSVPYPANVNGIALLSCGGPQPDATIKRAEPLAMNLKYLAAK